MLSLVRLSIVVAIALAVAAPATQAQAAQDPFTMTATSYTTGYSPSYVGNGYVGTRIPAQGMGFVANATVPTTTIVAGVWQRTPAQEVVSAAALPGWDELRFTDNGTDYSLDQGTVANWQQSVDMQTGAITTSLDWSSPAGHTTHLQYDVLADLARPHVATVRLRLTPAWTGQARVTDVLGSGASNDLTPVSSSAIPGHRQTTLTVKTPGTNVTVGYASQLAFTTKQLAMTANHGPRSASIAIDFATRSGTTYEFSKTVGIATSQDSSDPQGTAATQAKNAPAFTSLLSESQQAWADRWRSDIVVPDDPALQREIRAAQFYLQESIRPGTDWSISPVGLSSSGYNDHVFWDAETWMYPSLLLLHPDVASSVVNYRANTIAGARANAQATGYAGTRFAWESANDGTEQTPTFAGDAHLRAAHHLGRRLRPVAVLPRDGRQELAGEQGLAGASGRSGLLGQPGDLDRQRELRHHRRRGPRRASLQRRQRGLHQRRRDHDAASGHTGSHAARQAAQPRLEDGRRRGCRCCWTRAARYSRVRGLHRRPRQAGRRGHADLPVGVERVADDRAQRPQLLQAAHRPRRAGDDRLDPCDRLARARRSPAVPPTTSRSAASSRSCSRRSISSPRCAAAKARSRS